MVSENESKYLLGGIWVVLILVIAVDGLGVASENTKDKETVKS